MKDRNSILWQKANKTLIRTTHFKVTTVSAGLIYEFRVYAENAAGIGKASHPSDPVLAIDACGMYSLENKEAQRVKLSPSPLIPPPLQWHSVLYNMPMSKAAVFH